MRNQRIPETDSIEELAAFWDTHDLTRFQDQLEEVAEPIFVRGQTSIVEISLKPSEVQTLKRIAQSEGIEKPVCSGIGSWRSSVEPPRRQDYRSGVLDAAEHSPV